MVPRSLLGVGFFALLLTGCDGEELTGNLFDLTLTGADNQCTGNGTDHTERHQYRVDFDNTDLIVAVGEDVWATGTIDGCNLEYTSIVWSSLRGGFEIEWQISGQAQVDVAGGDGCATDDDDWVGTETFLVTNSAHPKVQPGCTYSLDVSGDFAGYAGPPPDDNDVPEPVAR
ncbi:MAG: hypothetical protein KTR31_01505 [Myxococcales bacterium]|nr:hypothetical protein [Myxococcales bacterium]